MTALFITILNMSIAASVVTLAVMIVRIPLKKAPKIFSYVLWGVVLFRLVCPFSIESIFSLMPTSSNAIPQDITYAQNPAIQTGVQFIDAPINTAISNVLPFISTDNSINPINTIFEIAEYVWLFGFVSLLLYATIGYIRLKRRVYYATLVRDNIYETDKIKTPFVLGFIRPKIYMPIGIDPSQHDYILKHEQTHIRRRDYLIKPFAFIVFALHWFNPLMWAAYLLMSKDIEMSCDEAVLRKADEDIRGVYSSSLLNLSANRVSLLSPLAFGESDVKSRIKNVLKFKKTSRVIIVLSMVFVAVFSMGFTMNRIPQINSGGNVPDEIPAAINTTITNDVLSSYIADGGLSRVVLLENNRFYVEGRPEISYTPTGSYEIDGNKLYLNVSENQQFIFSIYGNSLIFESGEWLENWIAKETVFILLEDEQ